MCLFADMGLIMQYNMFLLCEKFDGLHVTNFFYKTSNKILMYPIIHIVYSYLSDRNGDIHVLL